MMEFQLEKRAISLVQSTNLIKDTCRSERQTKQTRNLNATLAVQL